MAQLVSTNATLIGLGMDPMQVNTLSQGQKSGIMKLLDGINTGLHKTNNIPGAGTGLSNTAATSQGAWRPGAGYTLASAYEGINQEIMHTVVNYMLQDQNWLTLIAVNVPAETGGLQWSSTEFSPQVPGQVPARGRVRLLSFRKTSGAARMTRKGIGAEFDLEILENGVPGGYELFINQLTNINLSVSEGLRIDLMWQIMTAMLTHPVHLDSAMVARMKVRGLMDLFNRMTFSAVSSPKCVQLWMEHFKAHQRMLNVAQESEEHVWIMHHHTALRLHNDNSLVHQFAIHDLMENPFKIDAPAAWAYIMGERVFIGRPFFSTKDAPYDPMLMNSRIGLDFLFADTSRIWPDKPWSPEANIMNVPDLELGSLFAIDYPQLIHNCGRFDPGTGDAVSFNDYRNWGAVTPDQFARIKPSADQFHPAGSENAAFVVGSAPGFSGERALHTVGTFLKARPDLAVKLNVLVARVEEIAKFMEAATPSPELLQAIRELKHKADIQTAGIRPEGGLKQAEQDPSIRFVTATAGLVAETGKTRYPPFFASGGGFSFLASHGTADTKSTYAEIIASAREIASQLSGLSDTLALDPAYSASGVFNSDPALLLIDAILPMRPNLFVRPGRASDDSQAKDAAEGYKKALSKYPGLPNVTDANVERAFVAYSMLYKFQNAVKLTEKHADRLATIANDIKSIVNTDAMSPDVAASSVAAALGQHVAAESVPKEEDALAALRTLPNDKFRGFDRDAVFRTPFRVAPEQLSALKDTNFTVQRIGEFDQPAQPAELDVYIAAVKSNDPTQKYAQGLPIGRRTMIFGTPSVRIADAATRALRPRSALASSVLSSAYAAAAPAVSNVMTLWNGADVSKAASAAVVSRKQTLAAAYAMSGVADPRAADIVTAEFVRAFNDIGRLAITDAHAVLARIFLTLPLNANALISAFRAGFPPVLEFHNLTVLEVQTYPVIRLPPGVRTLIWGQSHEMLNWGVNAQSGMLGIYFTFYTGTAAPEPRRTLGIEGVDPVNHIKGCAGRFENGATFATEARNGGLLPVAYFAPAGYSLGDHYFSLTGGVALGNSAVSADLLDLDDSLARFERIRTGVNCHSGHTPAAIAPPVQFGMIVQPQTTTPFFTRSSSQFGNGCVIESHSPIPTSFHNSMCKNNLFTPISNTTVNARSIDTK